MPNVAFAISEVGLNGPVFLRGPFGRAYSSIMVREVFEDDSEQHSSILIGCRAGRRRGKTASVDDSGEETRKASG